MELENLFKDEKFVDLVDNLTTPNLEKNTENMNNILRYFHDLWNLSKFIKALLKINPDILNYFNKIPDNMFLECDWLTDIIIPDNITDIGKYAFRGCSGLTNIILGNSVTSIERDAFDSCENLTSITIPNSVTSIGDWVFSYCTNLTSITLPNSIISIGYEAFYRCIGLTITTDSDYVEKYCKRNKIKCKRI